MPDIDINQLLEILPRLIRENDTVKGAIITALSGIVATREDIKDLIREMDKRFEVVDRRFADMQAQMDKRFADMQAQMDKRFEAMDKRFEAMDKRFEAMDKRFDIMEASNAASFKTVITKLDALTQTMGVPFEQFARNVVARILEGEGITKVILKKAKLDDKEGLVFPQTKEVEIDGLSIDPPIIMEVTAILQDKTKVDKYIMKKQFVERMHGKPFRGFFIATKSELTRDELGEILVLLRQHGSEFLNL